jgi:hypothetical protein
MERIYMEFIERLLRNIMVNKLIKKYDKIAKPELICSSSTEYEKIRARKWFIKNHTCPICGYYSPGNESGTICFSEGFFSRLYKEGICGSCHARWKIFLDTEDYSIYLKVSSKTIDEILREISIDGPKF